MSDMAAHRYIKENVLWCFDGGTEEKGWRGLSYKGKERMAEAITSKYQSILDPTWKNNAWVLITSHQGLLTKVINYLGGSKFISSE